MAPTVRESHTLAAALNVNSFWSQSPARRGFQLGARGENQRGSPSLRSKHRWTGSSGVDGLQLGAQRDA